MKKMTIVLAMTALFAACKNYRSADNTVPSPAKSEKAAASSQPVSNADNQGSYTTATTHEAKKKKGISKAAKGAIIGGAAGAVTVGLITKSGKGAVVGGILGAGTGYMIGRKKDKRDGRVQ